MSLLHGLRRFLEKNLPSRLPLCPGAALSGQLHSKAMRLTRRLVPAQIAVASLVNLFAESAL